MPKKIRRIFVIKNQAIVWQRYMGGGERERIYNLLNKRQDV